MKAFLFAWNPRKWPWEARTGLTLRSTASPGRQTFLRFAAATLRYRGGAAADTLSNKSSTLLLLFPLLVACLLLVAVAAETVVVARSNRSGCAANTFSMTGPLLWFGAVAVAPRNLVGTTPDSFPAQGRTLLGLFRGFGLQVGVGMRIARRPTRSSLPPIRLC